MKFVADTKDITISVEPIGAIVDVPMGSSALVVWTHEDGLVPSIHLKSDASVEVFIEVSFFEILVDGATVFDIDLR